MTFCKTLKCCTHVVPFEIKKPFNFLKGSILLVAGTGLEPVTFGLWARRATYCSIPRYNLKITDLAFNFRFIMPTKLFRTAKIQSFLGFYKHKIRKNYCSMLSAWKPTNSEFSNSTEIWIGLQQTSQSSIYFCFRAELSNNTDICSQQYGQVKKCSIMII